MYRACGLLLGLLRDAFTELGQDLGGLVGPVVEDCKTARVESAGNAYLLDQLADIGLVGPDAQADAGIAWNFARPGKLLAEHALESAAGSGIVHRTDKVEVSPVAPELPVLADGVAVAGPASKDRG